MSEESLEGGGSDPIATFVALGGASRDKADAFLDDQASSSA